MTNLNEALAKAQAGFPVIEKKRVAKIVTAKGSYTYLYADLNDVLNAVRPVLNKHGISVTQRTVMAEHGLIIRTELRLGDELLDSEWPLALQQRPQETGANLSYYRRYALTALLGIAAEETTDEVADGESDKAVKKADFKPHKGTVPMNGPMNKNALQQEIRALVSHLEGASDMGELVGILNDHQEIIDQTIKDLPGWYYGDDRNPDYEPLEKVIDRRRNELEEQFDGQPE